MHHAFAKILAEGGIRGLWAGWVPNIQRAALVNMGGNGNFVEFCEVLIAVIILIISTPSGKMRICILLFLIICTGNSLPLCYNVIIEYFP